METVIDKEIRKKEPSAAQKKISLEVRKNKFKYKKNGKLREDEIIELRKSTKNVFDWMAERKYPVATEVKVNELEDDNDNELVTALEKEERLERVRRRMMVWEARQVSRSIVESILADVFRAEIRKSIENILVEVV